MMWYKIKKKLYRKVKKFWIVVNFFIWIVIKKLLMWYKKWKKVEMFWGWLVLKNMKKWKNKYMNSNPIILYCTVTWQTSPETSYSTTPVRTSTVLLLQRPPPSCRCCSFQASRAPDVFQKLPCATNFLAFSPRYKGLD
jgi:hypothetical protein